MSNPLAVTFTGLTQALLSFVALFPWFDVLRTIRTGEVAIDLARPVDFYGYWWAQDAGRALQAPWQQVLQGMKGKGTDTGSHAGAAVEQLLEQARTAVRTGRATGMNATQAMMDSYASLVSGVLIGMSEGLQPRSKATAGSARRR